jgi:RNA polymerase sigma factor (sigma-70 family)
MSTHDESLGSISLFFQQLQQGDREAVRPVWTRFFPRMMGLARRVLSGRRLPAGAEDAVQEAFVQFFQRVERGDYQRGLHRDDLWKLLSMMTYQIARKQTVREHAQKRGAGRIVSEVDLFAWHGDSQAPERLPLEQVVGTVSTAEYDLICEELLDQLEEELRAIAVMRLAGYTNQEIKQAMNCSLRSVERRLQLIRAIWSEYAAR